MAKNKPIKIEAEDKLQKGQINALDIKDELALVSQIKNDFQFDYAAKAEWFAERNLDVKAYFGIKKKTEWPFKGAAKISSGFHRISVDTVVANQIKSIFAPERPIKCTPSNSESLEAAKYNEDLANWQQENEYKLNSVLDKALPNAFVESFSVLSPVYEYLETQTSYMVTRLVSSEVPTEGLRYEHDTDSVVDAEGQPVLSLDPSSLDGKDLDMSGTKEVTFEVEHDYCIFDGVKVQVIGAERFFMPIFTPGDTPHEKVQRASHIVHQMYYPQSEIDQMGKDGKFKNTDSVRAEVYTRLLSLANSTKYSQTGFNIDTEVQRDVVEVLKWSGKWEYKGKMREVTAWVASASGQLLRVEPNVMGQRPYFPLVPFPVDDTPYGESLPKIIRPLVATLDLLMSTVTNIALLRAAPPKFFDPASGFNPSQIGSIGPNSWIPAREPGRNVLIPPQPEDPTTSMQMVQLLINIIERVTSVNETVQGNVSDRANTTATEVSQALVRSGVRFDLIYGRIKAQLSPMFDYIQRLNLRYLPLEKEIAVMGTAEAQIDGVSRMQTIHREKLAGKVHYTFAGNSVVTEQAELNKAVTLFNTVGQHPYLSYKPESVYYMLFNIIKHLNPIAMNKILAKPEEVKEILRSRQQVQNEQEQSAVEGQSQDGQAQAAAQAAQMDAQAKAQTAQVQMQMEMQKHQMEMKMQEDKHNQEMKQNEEKHAAELEAIRAKAKNQPKKAS